MKNQNKDDKNKKKINPVMVAVTGAVVGVAVAGALILKDEKNREKVKEVFTDAKDQAAGFMNDMKK